MTKIAAISLLVFMAAQIHVFAATAEDEIATEKLLDSRCQAGGGPSGTAWASCDARGVAIKELEKEGWCRSRGSQWRECNRGAHAKGEAASRVASSNGDRP